MDNPAPLPPTSTNETSADAKTKTAAATASASRNTPAQVWRAPRRGLKASIALILITTLTVLLILYLWHLPPFAQRGENTANAYVRGRTTLIAPQVSGYVTEVLVKDYEEVKANQVLAKIDDRIYRARVEQARANLDAQLATLANNQQARAARRAGLQVQTASLANAKAQLQRAEADMARVNDLVSDGSVSLRERDQTLASLHQAQAQVQQAQASGDIARQDIRTVEVSRLALEAQVSVARAQLRLAEIDLNNTEIRAPEAGQVGEISVRLGQYVTNGTQLLSLVPAERWVIANFKETQLHCIQAGQQVDFSVDALGGAHMSGHVERLSPATGAEFSVLKTDTGTGNFVKIPQRIGVRISIDPQQRLAAQLRPGMSVETQISACLP